MKTLPVGEFKAQFSEVLAKVKQGESFGILYGKKKDSHFDPFDRMLIWQAIQRNLTMVSRDSEFEKFIPYGLKLLWK